MSNHKPRSKSPERAAVAAAWKSRLLELSAIHEMNHRLAALALELLPRAKELAEAGNVALLNALASHNAAANEKLRLEVLSRANSAPSR